MRNKSNSSGIIAASVAGFILGGLGAAFYLIANDTKKQENIKNALHDAKNVTTNTLDRVSERIRDQVEDTEDELSSLRKEETGLTVH